MSPLKLMAVLAHPDDESLGVGGTLAAYAAEGIETHLVTATRGERGWTGDPREQPSLEAMGALREQELRAAAAVLGLHGVSLLDYIDGALDQAPNGEAISKVAAHLRRVRPQVVVTFDPYGAYGHPDHIAICQITAAAIVAAADSNTGRTPGTEPHAVSKFYYMVVSERRGDAYQAAFGKLVMTLDGTPRGLHRWPDWAITTRLDTAEHWPTVWRAVSCHRSQLPNYAILEHLPAEQHMALWGMQEYWRVFSLCATAGEREDDLFAGLR